MTTYPAVSRDYCYYALALCILTERTPDQALHYFMVPDKSTSKLLAKEDIEDMVELKKTMTYEELAKIFNMKKCAVYNRIKRHLGVAR